MTNRTFTLPKAAHADSAFMQLPTEIHIKIFRQFLLFADENATQDIKKKQLNDSVYEKARGTELGNWELSKTYQKQVAPTLCKIERERNKTNKQTLEHIRDGLNFAATCQFLHEVGSRVVYRENQLEASIKAPCHHDVRISTLMNTLHWVPKGTIDLSVANKSDFKVHTSAEVKEYSDRELVDLPVDEWMINNALATIGRFRRVKLVIFNGTTGGENIVDKLGRSFRGILEGKHVEIIEDLV